MNSTSGRSGEAALAKPQLRSADVVAWQERKWNKMELADARVRIRNEGWNALFMPCVMSEVDGHSGGVAILTRKHISQLASPIASASGGVPGRVLYRHVSGFIPGGVLVVTVYLPTRRLSADRTESNDIILDIGKKLAAYRRPFIVLGDWNCDPQAVLELGVANRLEATLVYTTEATCY